MHLIHSGQCGEQPESPGMTDMLVVELNSSLVSPRHVFNHAFVEWAINAVLGVK